MSPSVGYQPILGCCKPPKDLQGRLYLCPVHGYKNSELIPEGEQLTLELC